MGVAFSALLIHISSPFDFFAHRFDTYRFNKILLWLTLYGEKDKARSLGHWFILHFTAIYFTSIKEQILSIMLMKQHAMDTQKWAFEKVQSFNIPFKWFNDNYLIVMLFPKLTIAWLNPKVKESSEVSI